MDLKQFDILLHDAEVKLKRLKALYEQWFQGIERLEPTVPRKDLDRHFLMLSKEKPRNTAARFRLQQLQASYNLYQSHWQRIARQIEEGTYERDLRRARKRRGPARPSAPVKTFELDIEIDELEMSDPEDDIAAALGALAAQPAPTPTPAAKRGTFSAFSPFAAKPKAEGPVKATRATFGKPAASTAAPNPASATSPRPSAPGSSTAPRATPATAPTPSARAPLPPPNPRPAAPVPSARGPLPPPNPRPAATAPVPSARVPLPPPNPRPAAPTPAARAAAPPPSPRPASPEPRSGVRPQPTDEPLRRLYDDFVAARRKNNEPTQNLQYDKMVESVRKMESKLRAKHAGKPVDFEVVVRDGRVGLKPKIG